VPENTTRNPVPVLVVDSDPKDSESLVVSFKDRGYDVVRAKDAESAYNVLDSRRIDVMVAELNMRGLDSIRLLQVAKKRNPDICVVMIADRGSIERATNAMREGVYDFQTKPLNFDKLHAVVERGVSHQRLVVEAAELHRQLDTRFGLGGIVGNSPEMIVVYNRIRQIAPTRATVLITGPTGSGKELVARAIHLNSTRLNESFVTLDCASLSEHLIESELFGHVKGAFTDAVRSRKGRFEIADGGTLFLDELGNLPLRIQAKLLRVLETQQFERVGDSTPINVDVRLIAATNVDLEEMEQRGEFRRDLYYRLNVVSVNLPPLKERSTDIPLLVNAFIEEFNAQHGKSVRGITKEATELLRQYDWPGNVRELKNIIEGLVIMSHGSVMLDVRDLLEHIRVPRADAAEIRFPVGLSMAAIERIAIEETLKSVENDKPRAAAVLGIGLRTLYRKLKSYEEG